MRHSELVPEVSYKSRAAQKMRRDYMEGIERGRDRVRKTNEIFTPDALVQDILESMAERMPEMFRNPDKTFIDPACGDGQFLTHVFDWKMQHGRTGNKQLNKQDIPAVLNTIFGIDMMPDNVRLCRKRMMDGVVGYGISAGSVAYQRCRRIIAENIIIADSLLFFVPYDILQHEAKTAKELFEKLKQRYKNKDTRGQSYNGVRDMFSEDGGW